MKPTRRTVNFAAALWIDPGRRSGRVCINGTRLTVQHAARGVAELGVDEYRKGYCDKSIPRRSILVACAYFALHDKSRDLPADLIRIRKHWLLWAERTWRDAWHVADEHPLSDPPSITRKELTRP